MDIDSVELFGTGSVDSGLSRQLGVEADLAMGALRRGVAQSTVRDPEADRAEGLSAIQAGDFEQAPKRGHDDGSDEHGENEPRYESVGSNRHQCACQQQKDGHAADGSAGATHQVPTDRHLRSPGD